MKIRIASALTKPVMTLRLTNLMYRPSFSRPMPIWKTPHSREAANRYSRPCSRTRVAIRSAMAPVAAEIIAGLPPTKAMVTAMTKLA
ncbi:hypothetical protein D3C73_935690 [compost metagenome]